MCASGGVWRVKKWSERRNDLMKINNTGSGAALSEQIGRRHNCAGKFDVPNYNNVLKLIKSASFSDLT